MNPGQECTIHQLINDRALRRTDIDSGPGVVAAAVGFGDGDGARIHGDLAGANVGDYGGVPRASLSMIEKNFSFVVLKCESAAEATKFMDLYRKGYDVFTKAKAGTVKGAKGPWTLAYVIAVKGDNRVTLLRTIDNAGSKSQYYLDAGTYRDQFFIRFEGSQPNAERCRPAFEKATRLIDERFPK